MFSNYSINNSIESIDLIYSSDQCASLVLFGILNIFIFAGSLIFNSALLWIFICHKDLKNSLNIFVMVLTFFNLVGTILEYPFIILSQLYCK